MKGDRDPGIDPAGREAQAGEGPGGAIRVSLVGLEDRGALEALPIPAPVVPQGGRPARIARVNPSPPMGVICSKAVAGRRLDQGLP